MKLTNLNREDTIGANSLLAELGPFRLVVDTGMSPKRMGREALPDFSLVQDRSLDFIIITHSHLDHLGALPVLMRRQPQAEVLMSLPTKLIAPRMLQHSCNVMKRQRVEFNIPEYPLYTPGDIHWFIHRSTPMAYGRPKRFNAHGETLEVTFFPAGHVPGAAGCRLVYKHRSIFFTGDVLFSSQHILPPADFPRQEFDTVVMETTRGIVESGETGRREAETERLIATIRHVHSRRGSVLIPAFALGRTQEIYALLHEARKKHLLPQAPVHGSKLGLEISGLFDEVARKTNLVNFRRKVLKELGVLPLANDFKPGGGNGVSSIFVLSSGMLVENTPSYRAAAALLENHQNALCFVGYCDPETPGGQILEAAPGDDFLFSPLDYSCKINAQIEKFDLSSHADREDLLGFAVAANPRAVVLTHGDPGARGWFFDNLMDYSAKTKILDPAPLETCDV